VKKKTLLIGPFAVLGLLFLASGCRKGAEAGASAPGQPPSKETSVREKARIAYPVEVEPVEIRSLTYAVNAVGSIDAFEKVQVTARVAGVVDRVLFSEGTFARRGQVLVEIEPERYRLAVEAAQASYEKAVASLADAEAGCGWLGLRSGVWWTSRMRAMYSTALSASLTVFC